MIAHKEQYYKSAFGELPAVSILLAQLMEIFENSV